MTMIAPSSSIILIFGWIERDMELIFKNIIASAHSLNFRFHPHAEDLLMTLTHCKFSTRVFHAFDTSFQTMSEVRLITFL